MSRKFAIGLEAALECELDGQPVTVTAENGLIVVNVASTKGARSMLRVVRGLGSLRLNAARVNAALIGTSQQLQVRVAEATVVVMGKNAKSGWLRLAGLPNVQIKPFRLLR
ncbi:MAG: hypothetical protein P8L85_10970 [Rubripirellula sp.]|nr:hypothetical protein [Rubripirellula sp.]